MENNPIETTHRACTADAGKLDFIEDESIDLVVTSPPYPMIQMWDELFSTLSPETAKALANEDSDRAFEFMHRELDKAWKEIHRVLKKGSFACINIGDATRTVGDRFKLYSNHSRIITTFRELGFDCLPVILWRKQTNAPNKFMGSGMLPSGAYVTLAHEYVLIFRKGEKKIFKSKISKELRMKSAFFWEERNVWFSDIWFFIGTNQKLNKQDLRQRSGAFPFELAYRLINMYSLYDDNVLDPFVGTGTTTLAALTCGRNSIGADIEKAFPDLITNQALNFLQDANNFIFQRAERHNEFVKKRIREKGVLKHVNIPHGFPVMTTQETGIELRKLTRIERGNSNEVRVLYEKMETEDNQ